MASLVNLNDKQAIPLAGLMTLGRSKGCFITLPDTHVSRQHALLRQQGLDDFWFTDLGSVNGSYINDERVITSTQLKHGDVIRIAHFKFRMELPHPGDSPQSDEPITDVNLTDLTLIDSSNFEATMLVSDVRGYTHISEKLSPPQLAQLLGGWYRRCYETLHQEGGIIDKFIGDAVLAYWPGTGRSQADKAMAAARGLIANCQELQQIHQAILAPHGLEFSAGVGIHMGMVSSGSAGTGGRTILGDAVNVTFRIESLTRQVPHKVLVSGEIVTRCPEVKDLNYCGEFEIKGRSAVMPVYAMVI